ncbi:hypothetical protein AB0O01_09910 [Streptomyces sp. NPDC093252]|uniref:hypothetical protein n=1 Tax=Streptomyces sp. NPDC093252 TaxID=3154980 RepID=UPI003429445E
MRDDVGIPKGGARLAGALSVTLAALMVAGYGATSADAADPEPPAPQAPVCVLEEGEATAPEGLDGPDGVDEPGEASGADEVTGADGGGESPLGDEIGPDRVPEIPDVRDGGGLVPDDPDGLVDE